MAYQFTKLNIGDSVASSGGRAWKKLIVESDEPSVISGSHLAFSSPSSFTLNVADNTKHWDGTLEYSSDASTWNTWDGTTTLSADTGKLYLRGTGNTLITGFANNSNRYWALEGSVISCIGNIENLLDYATVANGEHPTMANNCYHNMFRSCTSLVTAPELPATTLANYCYDNMFANCTSLIAAPELPATTLATGCYQSMFFGCTSLVTAPELPATTMAESCYSGMFYGCANLITAPELPATGYGLSANCYNSMFRACRSLTTAPELPAPSLDPGCYAGMFSNCTSLVTAPKLPAEYVAEQCYIGMFEGCINLVTLPELPARYLKAGPKCYKDMFKGCTKIKLSATQTDEYQTEYRIPTSGTGTDGEQSLTDMFSNTGGTFTGTPTITTTYYLHTSNSVV